LDEKTFLPRFLRIPFFCVFRRNFSQERGCGEVAGIPVFLLSREFFAGIPVGQEFLYLPRNSPDTSGFWRIPEDFCSRKKLLAQASKKGGSLLSKIWTKIDLFNLSPELLSIRRKLRLPIYPNRTPFTCGHHERDIYGDHAFCCERGSKKRAHNIIDMDFAGALSPVLAQSGCLFPNTPMAVKPLFHLRSDSTA
jgi:hypothetical protein